jgi:hypothetical protein
LIEPWNWLTRLKVRLVGVPPWLVPNRVSPWAMALIVAAAGPDRGELQRDRVELDPGVAKERRDLRHANLDRVAWKVVAARGEFMIPTTVQVVGRIRIAEQAGQPKAQVARVDRNHNVALVIDHVLEWSERVAPLAQHRVVDQALLTAQIAAVERHADVVAGGRLTVGGLSFHEQMRARTIGSRHCTLLACVRWNCSAMRPALSVCRDAWVAGPTEHGSSQIGDRQADRRWTVTVDSFIDLAELLGC